MPTDFSEVFQESPMKWGCEDSKADDLLVGPLISRGNHQTTDSSADFSVSKMGQSLSFQPVKQQLL